MILGKVFCSQLNLIEWQNEYDFKLEDSMDLWKIYIPNVVNYLQHDIWFLSKEELNKSLAFKSNKDRERYMVGKIYLRKILSKYLKIPPDWLKFKYNEFNKPFLDEYPEFKFNISYSRDYVLIALDKRFELGVDIVYMENKNYLYYLNRNKMTDNEIGFITQSETPKELFYRFWTRKEALLKAVGIGFLVDLKEISCCEGLNLVSSNLSSFTSSWIIRSFNLEENYSVSFAHDEAIKLNRFFEVETLVI